MTGAKKPGAYDYHPETKWYQTLWDLRNKEFRNWYVKTQRRNFRLFMKYEKHRIFEQMLFGAVLSSLVLYIFSRDTSLAVIRWPTDDVNELLKQPVWRKHRNELNARKEEASKMLEESNYIYNKNSSSDRDQN